MPNYTIYDVDLDVDLNIVDVLDECSEFEIEQVIKWFKANDIDINYALNENKLSAENSILIDNINKIQDNYFRLTSQQIYFLNKIADEL